MPHFTLNGIIRNGRVEIAGPIDLPDGSEVTITAFVNGQPARSTESERPMTLAEIAQTLAAMDKVEPFETTDEVRAAADAWERQVNDYTIANLDRGVEDVFR